MAIHKYQLIRELGRGGMGAVFLARDTRLGRLVAIKVLHSHGDDFNRRFIAEARTTAKCSHTNIVVLYEADEFQGLPYMVLEYIEGQSLRELMAKNAAEHTVTSTVGPSLVMSIERAVELIRPVLRALERAHAMGIVHRDLKPANIMVTTEGKIKVLDFGIAKVLADRELSSMDERPSPLRAHLMAQPSSGIMGTLPYMSPEQLCAQDVDSRTDIWALGIMLFEMVTGDHPLDPVSNSKLEMLRQARIDMPRIRYKRPDLGKLDHIIDRCLIIDKCDRMATVRELRAELESLVPRRRVVTIDHLRNPFAGLAAFQESDAERFFGRSADIASLVNRVRHQPLIAVAGPSGVGKSSLVRAGVIPALKRLGEGWESVVIRPGRAPLNALAEITDQFTARLSPVSGNRTRISGPLGDYLGEMLGDRRSVREQLMQEPGVVGTTLRAWAQRKRRRILVFVDQFEELYTTVSDPAERAAFLACLRSLADDASSPLRVILAIRSDFLERMAEDRAFVTLATRELFVLPAMGRDCLREALVSPVEAVCYRFEDEDMVESMLQELERTRGALPLLQFTAVHLWDRRDLQRRLLTRASFDEMGGIAGVLARHADATLARMTACQARIARAIFERLVTPERTRAVASMADIRALPGNDDEIEHVLGDLAGARLLIVEVQSGLVTSGDSLAMVTDDDDGAVEIAHESLIASWPRLRRWLDENQDDAEFLARLRSAARQWEKSGRADGMLWRGEVALEAQRWRRHSQPVLGDGEARFLDSMLALTSCMRRRRRNVRLIVFVLLCGLLVFSILGLLRIVAAERDVRLAWGDRATSFRDAGSGGLDRASGATGGKRGRESAEGSRPSAEPGRGGSTARRRRGT